MQNTDISHIRYVGFIVQRYLTRNFEIDFYLLFYLPLKKLIISFEIKFFIFFLCAYKTTGIETGVSLEIHNVS